MPRPEPDFQTWTGEKSNPDRTGKNKTRTGSNYPDRNKMKPRPDRLGVDQRSTDRPIDRPSDRAIDRSTDRATERPSDRATDRPIDRAAERPSDRATERPKIIITRAPEVHFRLCLMHSAAFFKTKSSKTLPMLNSKEKDCL